MKCHEIPTRPWSKISAHLFQLDGSNYPVMFDHYSDFFELDPLGGNTLANAVIRAMKRQFARFGIPDKCITDNGTQFESYEYSRLLENMVLSYANHHHTTAEGTERRCPQSKLQRTI